MRKISNRPEDASDVLRPRRPGLQGGRHGYLYAAVAVSLGIIAVLALGAVKVARVQLRTANDSQDWQTARRLAQSGVELAIAVLNKDTAWKSKYAYGTEYPSPAVSHQGGRMTWKLTDLGGGDLRVDGIGRRGRSTCVLSANVETPAASALEAAICADEGLDVQSSTESLTAMGGKIATNGRLTNWGTLSGSCEAQLLTGSSPGSGSLTVPGPIRSVPDPQAAMAYYLANGTDITAALAASPERTKLRRQLLSPASNPYGLPNPQGIYILDLSGGNPFTITSSRIVGTLVVKNASAGVDVIEDVNWEPAIPSYPSLIVEGPLTLMLNGDKLDESKHSVNFNPSSTPWQGGSDAAADDLYPSALAGLVYCSGTLTLDGKRKNDGYTLSHQGILMTADRCMIIKGIQAKIKYEDVYFKNPPPGFESFNASRIEFGSWRQTPSF